MKLIEIIMLLCAVVLAGAGGCSADKSAEKTDSGSKAAGTPIISNVTHRLERQRAAAEKELPPLHRRRFLADLERLRQSQFLEGALKKGDHVPGFELQNALGNTVKSEDLLMRGPVVLVFYRGGW